MKVLKFGGTSLASAARMKSVLAIVENQLLSSKDEQILVVLSAVAGTTDKLVSIANHIENSQVKLASEQIQGLKSFYPKFISELFDQASNIDLAHVFIDHLLNAIESSLNQFNPSTRAEVLSIGELISTQLFHLLLTDMQRSNAQLNALEFLALNKSGTPNLPHLNEQLNLKLDATSSNILIVQGFICRNHQGEISNLNRGGSDYSASLFAEAIGSEELQIWTDIDGMHNNDPRYVKGTKTIRNISFDEAAELSYFGAKILHPSSIKPARKSNIPVRLLNTLQPEALGTLISKKSERKLVKAVAAKDGITAIKIRSSEMLEAQGFLRKIFEVFEHHKTSIDMVTTSEVAVSVTIDDVTYLSEIVDELSDFSQVDVDSGLSIISVVGEYLIENRDVVSQVTHSLKSVPVRMISYGGSPHNISLLVPSENKVKALNLLQQGLFSAE